MLFIITVHCVITLKHSLFHALSSQHLCKLEPKAVERQYEAGLVGCLMFSPASVSLINSWLSSVTNVSLPSSSPEEEEEEEEFLMFSLFYGSMFAAGIAVCVWYTLFFLPFSYYVSYETGSLSDWQRSSFWLWKQKKKRRRRDGKKSKAKQSAIDLSI